MRQMYVYIYIYLYVRIFTKGCDQLSSVYADHLGRTHKENLDAILVTEVPRFEAHVTWTTGATSL